MTFKDVLLKAKEGNHAAIEELLELYKPLLIRSSIVRGVFDEDLFQEQCIVLLRCIEHYNRFD